MWGVAASRGLGNGCPWGWVGGGRRPSAHEGEPDECKWAWEAAGLEPWALQDPGSEIQPRGSGHVWHPARVFTCAGDHLVRQIQVDLPHSTLGNCSAGLQLSVGSWWWWSCPSCSFSCGCSLTKSCRESSPTLTVGLSVPCLEAPAFSQWKYFESTWLSKMSL